MKAILLIIAMISLVSCSDGDSGGNGTGTTTYTHKQLADRFIYELDLDGEFEVEMVKNSTNQANFIVVYDVENDSYDALNISGFVPGITNPSDFFANALTYFDLDVIPSHQGTSGSVSTAYRDRSSGLSFEKTVSSPKDLAKLTALTELHIINRTAENYSAALGLSMSRSLEIAKLNTHWRKASVKSMTQKEVDAFTTELLGFSMTSGIQAMQSSSVGNDNAIIKLVERSAGKNGITPEHARKLMTHVFNL
jgi:hypothetical protein